MEKMEHKVIEIFLYEKEQKFNEIARKVDIRTNKLSYHIKNLAKKGILEKSPQGAYKLSETAEYLIPYISERQHTLPVILISIGNKKEAYLIKRQKRPFKNKLALPGGRLQTGENIEEASKRIMKEKFNIEIKEPQTKSISLEHVKKDPRAEVGGQEKTILGKTAFSIGEHVKKNEKTNHSFLLITVKAKTREKLELTNLENNKNEIISSDYKLIKETSKKPDIKELETEVE